MSSKYETQIQSLRPLIQSSESVLIALTSNPTVDELASALALFLAFDEAGKHVSVVTEGVIRVGHTNLFGVGQVQNNIPQTINGYLTIVLGGVVDPNQKKPMTLQELKWHSEGSDLHLVFHPLPGKKFEPTHITPTYEGGHFDLIFTIGVAKLEDIGMLYSNNTALFSHPETRIVNIDIKQNNTSYGAINIVDTNAASLSEVVGLLLPHLLLPYDEDTATNILTGIFDATVNLQNANADTFIAVAEAIRVGGQKPSLSAVSQQPEQSVQKSGFDLRSQPIQGQILSFSDTPARQKQAVSELKKEDDKKEETQKQAQDQASPEEMPSGEATVTPGSDWLTPKIYRGGSIE